MAARFNVMDLRRGFSPGGFTQIAEMPVRPQPDRGAVSTPPATGGSGGGQWDSAWERRARKVLGNKVGSRQDLMDPEHRKWINRKLRKRRAATTTTPKKPAEVVAPAKPAIPVESPTTPDKPVAAGPVVQPGYIVKKALQPKIKRAPTPGMPTRGYANA